MYFSSAALPLKDEAAETSSLPTFEEIGLSDELLAAVNDLELTNPTEIQALGIPEVLQGGDILLGSQTGSGKTLAYLLPVIQQLRYDEAEKELVTRPKRPRAVILVPTRELSEQVLSVAKSISHFARFRSTCILGGGKWKQQENALAQKVDVVVSTPGRLLQHVEKGNVFLGDMRYLVMDEADTMFESGFEKDMKKFLGALKKPGKPSQCILVAATVSKPVRRILEFELPDMRAVNAKSLHKAASNANHNFIRVPGNMNKLEFLRQVIDMENKKQKRTMIFCNTLDSCRAVEHTLTEFGCRTVTYHGEMPKDQRKESFAVFMEEDSAQVPLMVCTDLAARGLDFHQGVHHVVNFDFPLNSVDYMHRSGRTARAGASGNVTSLVDKRAETLAHQIHSRIQQGGSLDDVASNRTELKKRRAIEQKKAQTLKAAEARKAELRQKRLGKKFGGRENWPGPPAAPVAMGTRSPIVGQDTAALASVADVAENWPGPPAAPVAMGTRSPIVGQDTASLASVTDVAENWPGPPAAPVAMGTQSPIFGQEVVGAGPEVNNADKIAGSGAPLCVTSVKNTAGDTVQEPALSCEASGKGPTGVGSPPPPQGW
ncbi:hypothetical protein CYMTET_12818 [Cymbomonas tetramitiformis]|uniref:Uncharacterized protein n=1 Tax=Cymbomonas tetramitiformis TaxID=36881 RepID=A0AAE0LC20_9CHLO|nr:hypothetical protein CYMTET_12818 [Cymbomonas tetramitiformis]